jgi:hypothetical protein
LVAVAASPTTTVVSVLRCDGGTVDFTSPGSLGVMTLVTVPVGRVASSAAGASGSPCLGASAVPGAVGLCTGRLGRVLLVVVIAGPLLHAKQWVRSGRFSVKIGEIGVVRSLITNQNVK